MAPNEALSPSLNQNPEEQKPPSGFTTYVFDWEDVQSASPVVAEYYRQAVDLEKTIFREVFEEELDLSVYDEKSTFFLVCHDDEVAGVMRLVRDKDTSFTMSRENAQLVDEGRLNYTNPTLDYIKREPAWQKDFTYVFDQAQKADSEIVFGPRTVDITSWAVKKDFRRSRGASPKGDTGNPDMDYFDGNDNMAVNVVFFQQLYNWCMDNDIECVTAVYDDNPLMYLLKAGILKPMPGLEAGAVGGSKSSTPVYGMMRDWQQVHNENPYIRKFIFSEQYPIKNLKSPES